MSTTLSSAGAMVGLEALLAEVQAASVEPEVTVEVNAEEAPTTNEPEQTAATADEATAPPAGKKGKKKPAAEKKPRASKKAKTETAGDNTPAPSEPEQTAAPAPKPEKPKRVFFGRNVIGRLQHRLGDDLGKRLVLTTDDVELDGDAFTAAVQAATDTFKAMPVKHQYLASMLIERASDKRTSLTPVLDGALRELASARSVSSKSLQARMMTSARAHQKSTAATQAGVALKVLETLKITAAGPDGTYVPNEHSTLLAMLSERMALSFVDVEGAIREDEQREAEERAAQQVQVESNDSEEQPVSAEPTPVSDDVAALIDATMANTLQGQLDELGALPAALF